MPPKKETIQQKWPNYLVLVRHGQSAYNEEKELINRGILKTYSPNVKNVRDADLPLSKLGRSQAQKTGRYLKKNYKNFDLIIVSPYKRATETAQIIAKNFKKSRFLFEERIREKEFGILDGLTKDEVKKLFPYEYSRREKETKYYYRPIGGESYPDVNLRVLSFITTLVREYSGMNVMVVCHSVVMLSFKKLLEKLSEAELLKIDKEDELKNCAIVTYKYDPNLKPKPKMKLAEYNKVAW